MTLLEDLDDAATRAAVTAERSVLATLEAGCSAPLGALAEVAEGDDGDELWIRAVVLSHDGELSIRRSATGPPDQATTLGRRPGRGAARRGSRRTDEPMRTDTDKRSIVSNTAGKSRTTARQAAHPGWVSFVGSGPGDPDLLTVRAAELPRAAADVVVTEVPDHRELSSGARRRAAAARARPRARRRWLRAARPAVDARRPGQGRRQARQVRPQGGPTAGRRPVPLRLGRRRRRRPASRPARVRDRARRLRGLGRTDATPGSRCRCKAPRGPVVSCRERTCGLEPPRLLATLVLVSALRRIAEIADALVEARPRRPRRRSR